MSILQKFKRKPVLEELQERFPKDTVEPYGLCLIVPLKDFNKQSEEKLKSQGFKIHYQGYQGQTCAFVVLEKKPQTDPVAEKPSVQPSLVQEKPVQESDVKPVTSEAEPERTTAKSNIVIWTPQKDATLKELHSQGLTPKEIAERLECSVYSVGAKLRYLHKPQIKSQLKPREKQSQVSSTEKAETKSKADDSDIVKEFLSACSLLYPSHARACAFLLREASNKITENRVSVPEVT